MRSCKIVYCTPMADPIYGTPGLELFPFILIMETKMKSLETKSSEEFGRWVAGLGFHS